MSKERFLAAVETAYEATIHPDRWPEFLVAFNRLVNGWVGQYMVWDESSQTNAVTFISDPAVHEQEKRYSEYYGAVDPRRRLLATLPEGQWLHCHEHFDSRFVAGNEFYQDFLIPMGGRFLAAAQFGMHHGLMPIVGMHRNVAQGPFDRQEREWMSRLQPHLDRAIRLHLKVHDLGLKADLMVRTLDALSYPILLLDERCRVQLTNQAADRWLVDNGLVRVASGVLHVVHPKLQCALARLILLAAAQGHGSRQGGALAVPRKEQRNGRELKPYSVLVIPLRADANLSAPWQRPLALLLVVDPDSGPPLDVPRLQALFRLTPSEASLVLAVSSTRSLEEAAQRVGISLNTAKTQLQSAFAKTGTCRQAELAKLLFSHPAVKSG